MLRCLEIKIQTKDWGLIVQRLKTVLFAFTILAVLTVSGISIYNHSHLLSPEESSKNVVIVGNIYMVPRFRIMYNPIKCLKFGLEVSEAWDCRMRQAVGIIWKPHLTIGLDKLIHDCESWPHEAF